MEQRRPYVAHPPPCRAVPYYDRLSWCCRNGDPSQGLRVGSSLTFPHADKANAWGTQAQSSKAWEPRSIALPPGSQPQALGDGVSFRLSGCSSCLAGNWSDSGSFLVARLSAKMDSSMRVSGRWAEHVISSLLHLVPPKFFQVSFTRRTMGWQLLPAFGQSKLLLVHFQKQYHLLYQDLLF